MGILLWMAVLFTLMIVFLVTLVLYEDSPKFQYRFKFCFFVVYVSLVCLLTIPFNMFNPGNVENLLKANPFVKFAAKMLGIKYEISGSENLDTDEPCVIVCNHQSILDTLVMAHAWPKRCAGVCKKELLYIFPFGLAAWLCGTVFIDRSKGKSINQLSTTAENFHKQKTKLWIFPEGTRHKGQELLQFKKGAFHIAMQYKLPIVPVLISPYTFINDEEETFEQGRVMVSILKPIPTTDVTDVNDLVDTTRDLMNAEFLRLSEQVLPNSFQHLNENCTKILNRH